MQNELKQYLLNFLKEEQLIEAVFSAPAYAKVRPVLLQKQRRYQVTRMEGQKARHANYDAEKLLEVMENELLPCCKEAIFYTTECDLLVIKDRIKKKKPTKKPVKTTHNRTKKHLLEEGTPLDFLIELGLMKPSGAIEPKRVDKFRQINRFLELLIDVLPAKPLRIVDFGCGKGYLTFALYHLVKNVLGREVSIEGIDLKEDVMHKCQALAKKLGFTELSFSVGDIQAFHPKESIDVVVALHACNTATDAALIKAMTWNAEIILAAPCCQHELYKQVTSSSLNSLLRHGILREKFAALVTDAIRADLLEAHGYATQVVEFVDPEHTPKNLLLRAIKGIPEKRQKEALQRYHACKAALQIHPTFETLLKERYL